jgi:hypothetical protein
MAVSNTSICNQALGRIAAKRINDFSDATETRNEAIQCRLHYEPTRDALQRAHFWVFNKARATLVEDTNEPDFEFTNQFLLPSDFLRFRSKFDRGSGNNETSVFSFSLETNVDGAKVLLTDEDAVNLRYSKLVTDPTKFDPLFIEVFVLKLARKLSVPLSGGGKLLDGIDKELNPLMASVKALDRNEGMGTRANDQYHWNDARLGSTLRSRPTVASS